MSNFAEAAWCASAASAKAATRSSTREKKKALFVCMDPAQHRFYIGTASGMKRLGQGNCIRPITGPTIISIAVMTMTQATLMIAPGLNMSNML